MVTLNNISNATIAIFFIFLLVFAGNNLQIYKKFQRQQIFFEIGDEKIWFFKKNLYLCAQINEK
jgi:hypothetical protein